MLGNGAMLAWTLVKYLLIFMFHLLLLLVKSFLIFWIYLTPNVGQKYHDQYNVIGPSFVISRYPLFYLYMIIYTSFIFQLTIIFT